MSTTKTKLNFKDRVSNLIEKLGRIGKALMFPIAVLPIAAILLRIGAQIPVGTTFSAFIQSIIFTAGNVVFANLPIIFAVGVGFGLTKDNRGEAALSALIAMLFLSLLMKSNGADLPNRIYGSLNFDLAVGAAPDATGFHRIFGGKYDAILGDNVLNGIIAGAFTAWLYNKYNDTSLPKVLGFFSGRRLIPVLTVLGILILGIVYAIVYPWIGYVIYRFSLLLSEATGDRYANSGIMGIYVLLNRLLIPFGLHHIPNTLFWFQLGEHVDIFGNPVYGDINIFINGIAKDNHAGTFQSGFFPMMMFGLPALVGAIYLCSDNKTQRTQVIALLGGAAIVSMLTGITEPIEFAFLFVAMPLYIFHAFVGAIFSFITGLFGIQLGFGFSAGLFDYLLSIPKAMEIINANLSGIDKVFANPGWIMVIGFACGVVYFFGGKFMIKRFNLQTPGRGSNLIHPFEDDVETTKDQKATAQGQISSKTAKIVLALGGYENITNFQNCATRLRYDVKDSKKVNQDALKKLGIKAVIKVSKTHVQVIVGPQVELLNNEIIAHKNEDLSRFKKSN